MTTVKYILEDGSEVLIEADVGQNLMQLALDNNLDGICLLYTSPSPRD